MLQSSSSSLLLLSSVKSSQRYAAVSCCLVLLLFLTQSQTSTALIVPNELPSILSLVYSNIPPIKKGTDSRLGFGFRLGEHADFQVLLELGPQKETRPIGNTEDSDGSSFNKRQVNKRQQLRVQYEMSTTERPAATWLEKWSNDANTSTKKKIKTPIAVKKPLPNKPVEMPTMPQLPDQTLRQLQMLYKMATTSTPETLVQASTESTHNGGTIDAATHLQERLKAFKAPASVEELQVLRQKSTTKTQITKELMDVNLDK